MPFSHGFHREQKVATKPHGSGFFPDHQQSLDKLLMLPREVPGFKG